MEATRHLAFIIGAYAAAVTVVGGLTAWVALDYRAQRRALADLDSKGSPRRPARAGAAGEQANEQAKEQA